MDDSSSSRSPARANGNLNPPLLEYWKPPKAVVFGRSKQVSDGKDDKVRPQPRTHSFPPDIKEEIASSIASSYPVDEIHPAYRNDINSSSNSIFSDSSATLSVSSASSSFVDKRRNRFTWADSSTTLVRDLESVTLKSIPWGYDEKSEKDRVIVTEREITSPDMAKVSGPPPEYDLDGDDVFEPRWYEVEYWREGRDGRKRLLLLALAFSIVAVIVIVSVVPLEVTRANRYPNYYPLNYTLVDQFTGTKFFDNFNYFNQSNEKDPTNGFVQYVDEQAAAKLNLTYAGDSSSVVRVDTSNSNATNGRHSVRITSKNTWDTGLFIFDVIHTPYGCATWPALWLADVPNWPYNGEIDVMEQVNNGTDGNIMTLHTSKHCSMKVKRKETGHVSATDCYNGTHYNAGCGVTGPPATYGPAFNAAGGGIMAMELRSAGIRIWQFPRSSIPSDITNSTPDPSTWGEAAADFPGTDCDIDKHFRNQSIIVNIEICGDWAGAETVYTTQDQCPGICSQYAATNGSAFETAYFEFGNFSVYQAAK